MKQVFYGIVLALLMGASFAMFGVTAMTGQSSATRVTTLSSGANWLSSWLYRKPHNITGSSAGDQVNYQVLICVHYGYGADFNGDVYLNEQCRSDFGDIRFTDSSGANFLNYYIESQVNAVQAVVWVKISSIPMNPNQAQIYIYYGNPNASTTSSKDLTFDSASDFEDGTKQGWTISWSSYISSDGVDSFAYEGNYSRSAGRVYGFYGNAGVGDFYERFQKSAVYLASGSYYIQAVACFGLSDSYLTPFGIRLLIDENNVSQIDSPGVTWHLLNGDFTLNSSGLVTLSIEFHLSVSSGLWDGTEGYHIDSIFLRRWCDPEPAQGSWGPVEGSADNTPPAISNISIIPTAPYPLVPSSNVRKGEPALITANVTDDESGVQSVLLCYRADAGEWWNTSMTYNTTTNLWATIIPGQDNNTSTVELFITAYDNAGNTSTSGMVSFQIQHLLLGDVNGDGRVNIRDISIVAKHFGEGDP